MAAEGMRYHPAGVVVQTEGTNARAAEAAARRYKGDGLNMNLHEM